MRPLLVFAAENFFIRVSKTNDTHCIFRIICIYLPATYQNKGVGIKAFIINDLTVTNDEESVQIQTLTEKHCLSCEWNRTRWLWTERIKWYLRVAWIARWRFDWNRLGRNIKSHCRGSFNEHWNGNIKLKKLKVYRWQMSFVISS